ncbi:MAG: hypothetical protein IPJ04_13865 [Candidatus Eisenbacteria bacterium]|nr:hypothetical protein [Candidatus Eisenbacteria bacterium]
MCSSDCPPPLAYHATGSSARVRRPLRKSRWYHGPTHAVRPELSAPEYHTGTMPRPCASGPFNVTTGP